MKKKYIGALIAAITLFPSIGNAQTESRESMQKKINEAVMNVYNEEIEKNPEDYTLLYSRASQYFLNGEYLKALDDVDAALKLTTTKDKEMLFEEYVLRAKINIVRLDKTAAINDLKEANRLEPTNQNVLFNLGNLSLDANDLETARMAYKQLLSVNSVDYNAMAGLAKVAVKEKNYGQAAEYANKAVELYPAEGNVYMNRADVLMMMNDPKGAAQDVISALSVSQDTQEGLQRLVNMSDTDYNAVVDALTNSIEKAPRNGMFYYIRSMVAMRHNHFADAQKDLNLIIKNNLYDYHGIYFDCAMAEFALGKYLQAQSSINKAITMNPSNVDYYTLKARIQGELGMEDDALASVNKGLAIDGNNVAALREKSELYLRKKDSKKALTVINEAVMNDPTIATNILYRAWLEKTYLKGKTVANNDYAKALTLGEDITTMRGIALHNLGKDDEARAWAEKMVQDTPLAGGDGYYAAAVVYAQCGDTDKAFSMLESALANGFGDYNKLMDDKFGGYNLEPLRKLPRFNTIMKQYEKVFAPDNKLTRI